MYTPKRKGGGHISSKQPSADRNDPTSTTQQRTRRMTFDRNSNASSIASPFAPMQTTRFHEGSTQKMANNGLSKVPESNMQRRDSHISHTSNNWRSSHHPSFNSSGCLPAMPRSVDESHMAPMIGIPEYLAVQEMAFRQGQLDSKGSCDVVPPSPFPRHMNLVWAEYYKLGAAYGKSPAASPTVASSPSHANYAWPVLINPATQDLEHPNGSIDMEWVRKICVMSLNGMRELIRVVYKRPNDWHRIVCDIPLPIKHAIVAFPDLCEYYGALQYDAREALNGRIPYGY